MSFTLPMTSPAKLAEEALSLSLAWLPIGASDDPECNARVLGAREQIREALAALRAMPTEVENTPEGCTPADARVLREANGIFAEENHQLRRTLRFYAHGEHYTGLKHWEGPSGDDNWLCPPGEDFGDYRKQFIDALDEAMVEDGTLARSALRGVYLDMDGEPELAPVEGEPEWKIEQEAKALLSPLERRSEPK